jgi:hypothetical protein
LKTSSGNDKFQYLFPVFLENIHNETYLHGCHDVPGEHRDRSQPITRNWHSLE